MPETLFSELVLTVSLFGREGEEAWLQSFTCGVQIGKAGKGGHGDMLAGSRKGGWFHRLLSLWKHCLCL